MNLLIQNLSVKANGKQIIDKLSLTINTGKVHVLMGPNGSGKSSLSFALMGHPDYKITKGQIYFDKKEITYLKPEEKSALGLFLGFQKPVSIPGLCYLNFLRNIYLNKTKSKKIPLKISDFLKVVKEKASIFQVSEEMIKKEVNFGLSGGEQKKMEMLTLSILSPKFAVLDEIDTGLDIDALKIIASSIYNLKKQMGILYITHNTKVLKYLKPDKVHVMVGGKIVKSGDFNLANEIEKKGFKKFK